MAAAISFSYCEEGFIDILEEISVNIDTSEVNPIEIRRNRE
ncbi:hypothetical protein [Bacillus sp. X1(2014)]|nr:hypothetical protein [Bacillus sp. X1(2014)]